MVDSTYQDLVCRSPTTAESDAGVALCCDGATEVAYRGIVQTSDVYQLRHNCSGCTSTCECTAGYYLQRGNNNLRQCVACDGKTGYAAKPGASLCEKVTSCGRGQAEVQAPTPSSDRVCALCSAGTIDHDGDGATSCTSCSAGVYVPAGSTGSCSVSLPNGMCAKNCRAFG